MLNFISANRYLFKVLNAKKLIFIRGFPGGSDSKKFACNLGDPGWIPGLGRYSGEGNSYPLHPVFLPGEFYGQKSLAGYSPWGCKESDTTERLTLSTLSKALRKSNFTRLLHQHLLFMVGKKVTQMTRAYTLVFQTLLCNRCRQGTCSKHNLFVPYPGFSFRIS